MSVFLGGTKKKDQSNFYIQNVTFRHELHGTRIKRDSGCTQVLQLERNDGALDIGNICKQNRKNIYTK